MGAVEAVRLTDRNTFMVKLKGYDSWIGYDMGLEMGLDLPISPALVQAHEAALKTVELTHTAMCDAVEEALNQHFVQNFGISPETKANRAQKR